MPLDPHAKRLLDRLAALNPPSARSLSVSERRSALEAMLGFSGLREEIAGTEELTLQGASGPLPGRLYVPASAAARPAGGLIYFHGGGLVAGSLDTHDGVCRSLANASGLRLVSVGYRLAPEHPFPAAVTDGIAAFGAISAGSTAYGLDPARLVICGDSAGATLAAVVCQAVARAGSPPIAAQVLLCPIMDFGAAGGSRRDFAQGYLLDEATLAHDLDHYLVGGGDAADARVSPLRARELGPLPPTCIHTAEFDPLRDEGAAYAERLRVAGVPTTYRCHSGMIHLFYGMGRLIPYAATAYRQIGADIRAMLA
jgi:acetyl esterase